MQNSATGITTAIKMIFVRPRNKFNVLWKKYRSCEERKLFSSKSVLGSSSQSCTIFNTMLDR